MRFTRIFTDETGETHVGSHEVEDRNVALGPPPNPPGQMSDCGPMTSLAVFSVPAGTSAPAHNAPQAYIAIVLAGEAEVVTSDGEWRRFLPGEILFCDDLTGKGHVTRAISDLKLAFVHRAQAVSEGVLSACDARILADAATGLRFT